MRTADRVLARTEVGWLTVSTVFLGLDHGLYDGPPVLWETMIFGRGRLASFRGMPFLARDSYDQRRYTSREDALLGHEEMVRNAREILDQEETNVDG